VARVLTKQKIRALLAKDLKWFKEREIGFYLVNSCKDCNNSLGDKPLFTLQERADFTKAGEKSRKDCFMVKR
jgi:hypothetical protein